MKNLWNWFREHEKTALLLLTLVFLAIRLPGLSQPLHQDEYKWPIIVNPTYQSDVSIPHPPLSEFIYRTAGEMIGFDIHFRYVPLFFSVLNLLLLYYVLKGRYGKKVATVGAVLFTISYFSVLASLMVDTDGAIMPFFFLCMLLAYDRYRVAISGKKFLLGLVVLFGILGLFIKVSFVLAVGAVAMDFLWSERKRLDMRLVARYGAYTVGAIVGFIILLLLSQKLFPFFHVSASVTYWKHFATGSRNWFQTAIQVVKAVLYTSPFLILTPLFVPRQKLKDCVPFLSYLAFGLMFYIVLFDFSLGALDRYMQFIIIPLCALSALAIVSLFDHGDRRANKLFLGLGIILSGLVFSLTYITHSVPSLYPKSAWISRAVSLRWDFLYPFSGGSGPLGFYISFLFMATAWIVSIVLVVLAWYKPLWRKNIFLLLIPLSLVYTATFTEEYLFGRINGSAPHLLTDAVTFIQNDKDISKVVVYNDNGGAEIQGIGKYDKRLYTSPEFNLQDKVTSLNTHKVFYLELNVPRIDPASVYRKYLDSCSVVYRETDHYISATVYDCRKVGDVRI